MRKRLFILAAMTAAAVATGASAVEHGTFLAGYGDGTLYKLNGSTGLDVNSAITPVIGHYYLQEGTDAYDDVASGVLISSVAEWSRDKLIDGSYVQTYMTSSVATVAEGGAPADGLGDYMIAVHDTQQEDNDVNVGAAYFPYAEGWIAGQLYSSDGDVSGTLDAHVTGTGGNVSYYDHGTGTVSLYIDGVDAESDGILLVNSGYDGNYFTMAAPERDGSWTLLGGRTGQTADGGIDASNGADYVKSSVNYVYVPYGTPGIVAGQISGDGAIQNAGTGGFSTSVLGSGEISLVIDGKSSTDGTLLLVPMGGISNNSDNIVSYMAEGGGYTLQTRDLPNAGLQNNGSEASWQFVWIPNDTTGIVPTATTTVDYLHQVSGGTAEVTEYNGGNNPGDMRADYVASTPEMAFGGYNRGDNTIRIQGHRLTAEEGVMFVSSNENYTDNTATGGVSSVPMAAVICPALARSNGYWVATHGADGSNPGETNSNFAVAYFPYEQGWSMVAGVSVTGGKNSVDFQKEGYSTDDGLLFTVAHGNDDNFTTAAPKADKSGWDVELYDNSGVLEGGNDMLNAIYLPFDTPNLIAGSATDTAAGFAVGEGKAGTWTLTKEAGSDGLYRLSVPGVDLSKGTLLLTANHGEIAGGDGTSNDNLLTYEVDGTDILIQGYDANSAEAIAEATNFSFAFIDFENAPTPTNATNALVRSMAVANFSVIGNDGNNAAPTITRLGTSDDTFEFVPANRGDNRPFLDGGRMTAQGGVMLTQVSDDYRDNTGIIVNEGDATADPVVPPTYGYAGVGLATPSIYDSGYEVAQSAINGQNPGEFDVDVAVAYFPYGGEWQGKIGQQDIEGKVEVLFVDGSGDSRQSGVLIANASGNDDNVATIQPNADGNGWTVEVYDNSGGLEWGDAYSYAYLPYGTENLTAGYISEGGCIKSSTGEFSVERVREIDGEAVNGVYRLTIKDQTPGTGALFMVTTKDGYSDDNAVTYKADGDSFLIFGYDMGGGAAGRQDTNFQFAFLPYETPVANPQLREALDPAFASAGNISVTQYSAGNGTSEIALGVVQDAATFAYQATDRFTVGGGNRGDYEVGVDGLRWTSSQGVMMATVRNNARDNGDGSGAIFGIVSAVENGTSSGWAAIAKMGDGGEFNADIAAATFNFAGNWACGHVASDGTTTADGLGTVTTAKTADGRYSVAIEGVDSASDGLLFTIAGSNSSRSTAVQAAADGSWDVAVYSGVDGTDYNDKFSYLYLPFGEFEGYQVANLIGAAVAADGSVTNGAQTSSFTLAKEAVGTYRLTVDGETPDTGMLLLTTAGLEDNIFTYEADGDDFLIVSNDLGNGTAGLLEDAAFNFAFLSFDSPLMMTDEAIIEPLAGDLNDDGFVGSADLDIVRANWGSDVTAGSLLAGDPSGDGTVGSADLDIVRANWGASAAASAVPEPSMILLLSACLFGLAMKRARN